MLLKRPVLDAIHAGRVSLVFRKWRRPTVKTGGTLKTAIGVLNIERVERVLGVSEADAKKAGYPSRAAMMAELDAYPDGDIYRIAVAFAGDDPRIALRDETTLSANDWTAVQEKLARMPWAQPTLDIISRNPAVVAATLAEEIGVERDVFKPRVRRLKELGLTESLEIGYRLSPRGAAYLRWLDERSTPPAHAP